MLLFIVRHEWRDVGDSRSSYSGWVFWRSLADAEVCSTDWERTQRSEEQLSVMMQKGQWDAGIGDDCDQLRSIARVLRSSSIVTELLGEDVQWVRDVRGW